MYTRQQKHTRQDVVKMLITAFDAGGILQFGLESEEGFYEGNGEAPLSKEECLKFIKDSQAMEWEGLSDLSEIHPAWIIKALELESPKVIGIVLRWLPSKHVRYILEHLPKRVKMSLPRLVESFAVPTQILRLIRRGFERKFKIPVVRPASEIKSFDEIAFLKADDLEVLFKDIGMHELAMAFQGAQLDGIKVLLNRMSVTSARAIQQRMKDVNDASPALLKDARYTILEIALDQEDIVKLLMEIGLTTFSKALKDNTMFDNIQLKLAPSVSYTFKRCVDQHAGMGRFIVPRQALILERLAILARAGEIKND